VQPARRERNVGLSGSGVAEDKLKARARGTKALRGRHRQVDLQSPRQQEHAVDAGSTLEIGEAYRVEFFVERARPVGEHRAHRDRVGDAERNVQI
jgi:hypothetical protein